jgi:hypothetical protein
VHLQGIEPAFQGLGPGIINADVKDYAPCRYGSSLDMKKQNPPLWRALF